MPAMITNWIAKEAMIMMQQINVSHKQYTCNFIVNPHHFYQCMVNKHDKQAREGMWVSTKIKQNPWVQRDDKNTVEWVKEVERCYLNTTW